MSNHPPESFFTISGAMRITAPSYIQRPADHKLFNELQKGNYCYLLTPRQMGKTSMIIRVALRLEEVGNKTAIVDITEIGSEVSARQWYLGILTGIQEQLGFTTDPIIWWNNHEAISDTQRFSTFIKQVVLQEVKFPVIIFIDEIDYTLGLEFADDFFGAIRAMHNSRPIDNIYNQLTFVLIGVATPADLIRNKQNNVFNIGQRISLREFTQEDARVLHDELERYVEAQTSLVFSRIFYWTSGHPYLTQKLCLEVTRNKGVDWNESKVDELVHKLFLAEKASNEPNLKYIRQYVESNPNRRAMLNTYAQVAHGQDVFEDEKSLVQNQLEVIGLLRSDNRPPPRKLVVRNRIYFEAFDAEWIEKLMPPLWQDPRVRKASIAAIALLLLIVAFVLWQLVQQDSYLSTVQIPSATPSATVTSLPPTRDETFASLTLTETAVALADSAASPTITIPSTPIPATTTITPTFTLTPIPSSTNTATPTDTPTATPIPDAIANQRALVFIAPDTTSLELSQIQPGEIVTVLGRSENRFGRREGKPGLFIQTQSGVEGYVVSLFFEWPGMEEELPIVQPPRAVAIFNSSVQEAPDSNSLRTSAVLAGEIIEILGKSAEGDWYYARTSEDIEGFVDAGRIDWRGNIEALPVVE